MYIIENHSRMTYVLPLAFFSMFILETLCHSFVLFQPDGTLLPASFTHCKRYPAAFENFVFEGGDANTRVMTLPQLGGLRLGLLLNIVMSL